MTAIAVLGTGNIGATLSRKWSAAGHRVVLGSRDPTSPNVHALAHEIGASAVSPTEAATDAHVVVFAIPGQTMGETVGAVGRALEGKIVIDATNNLAGHAINSVAAIRAVAPTATVARAFNSLGWENFDNPDFDGVAADLLWCGPEGDAGATVEQLISAIGLRPIRVGGLDQLELVDQLVRLWFALAITQRHGRHLAFKVLTR